MPPISHPADSLKIDAFQGEGFAEASDINGLIRRHLEKVKIAKVPQHADDGAVALCHLVKQGGKSGIIAGDFPGAPLLGHPFAGKDLFHDRFLLDKEKADSSVLKQVAGMGRKFAQKDVKTALIILNVRRITRMGPPIVCRRGHQNALECAMKTACLCQDFGQRGRLTGFLR